VGSIETHADPPASRKYLVIRGMPDKDVSFASLAVSQSNQQGESGREAQIRFTKEFYEVAEEWDP
jgi:hypothetical protein